MKRNIFSLFVFGLLLLTSGFSLEIIPVPTRKIQKAVSKILKSNSFKLIPLKRDACDDMGRFFGILDDADTLGYVFAGRVNSCRTGGCFAEHSETREPVNLEFEYFDYFVIYGKYKEIKRVQIYNYQATHGQDVGGRGWLNQFKGYAGTRTLEYGSDIEAISGATVSAMAMIESLQAVTTCLNQKKLP